MVNKRRHFMRVTSKKIVLLPPFDESIRLKVIVEFLQWKRSQDPELLEATRLTFAQSETDCVWCQQFRDAELELCLNCYRPFNTETDLCDNDDQ